MAALSQVFLGQQDGVFLFKGKHTKIQLKNNKVHKKFFKNKGRHTFRNGSPSITFSNFDPQGMSIQPLVTT